MRYAAFLRAVNVGGRVVKMDRLRGLFSEAGFSGVSTHIASGNVLFTAARGRAGDLERKLETALGEALGFEVATFLRTPAELEAIAARRPFTGAEAAEAHALYVGFLKGPLPPDQARAVLGFAGTNDALAVHGREIHWLCRERSPKSIALPGRIEKALRLPATFRNVTTVGQVRDLLAPDRRQDASAPS